MENGFDILTVLAKVICYVQSLQSKPVLVTLPGRSLCRPIFVVVFPKLIARAVHVQNTKLLCAYMSANFSYLN